MFDVHITAFVATWFQEKDAGSTFMPNGLSEAWSPPERRLLLRLFIQLFLEAVFEFGADFGNFHSRAHQKLAAQQFVRLVLIRQFAGHAAILAILIPAEPSVGNGFRADVLKTAENRILLWNLERFAKNVDRDQPLVGSKDLIGPARANCFRDLRLTCL
jgi:hypothetical protein